MDSDQVIDAHERAGRRIAVGSVNTFIREEGSGDPVLCLHGVPTSSFLYRKVLVELAQLDLRGVALDLPGLGLSDRPTDFDYSWSGLGEFVTRAVDVIGLDRFHLVVHDIGGPVGFEVAHRIPDRIRSLTVLNAPTAVASFARPWSMEPFAHRGVGKAWLAGLSKPMFRSLMRLQGVGDLSRVSTVELDAYVDLLKRGDGGKAFLSIMRDFERTAQAERRYVSVLRDQRYPVQIIWGEHDPALTVDHHGEQARILAGLERIHRLPGKHFFQEEQAPAIARLVADFADRT